MEKIKEGYKKTEIGIIPQEWEVVKIEETGKILSGGTPDTKEDSYWNGDINWCTPTDITALKGSKYIIKTARKITTEGLHNSSATKLPPYSLVVCTRATIGDCAINTDTITTNQGFKSIVPNTNVNIEYLYYLITNNKDIFIKLSSGSTFLEISKKAFSSVSIPLPPLSEQQKIAEILGTADDKLAQLTAEIAKTKELKKGLSQKLLTKGIKHSEFKDSPLGKIPKTWEVVKLGDIADVIDPHPSHRAPKETSNGHPFIGIGDINESGWIDLEKCRKISLKDVLAQKETYKLENYDIGFGRVGSIGKVVWLFKKDFPYAISPTMALIQPKINRTYLNQVLKSSSFYNQFNNVKTGSTRASIGMKNLREMFIPLPSKDEIDIIAEILGTVDAKLEKLQAQKAKTTELKKGLMQQLLTGKIRVVH